MTAYRHRCPLQVSIRCLSGPGKPTRRRCPGCGSELRTETGRWGTFVWTGESRYPETSAVALYSSFTRAESAAGPAGLVVRWLSS